MKIISFLLFQIQVIVCVFPFLHAQNDLLCGTKGPPRASTQTSEKTLNNNSKRLGIINGQEAIPHEFPFAASIGNFERKNEDDPQPTYNPKCTAAVIHSRYLLTAAHCAHFVSINASAVLAAHNVSSDAVKNEAHKLTVPIEKIIKHPRFKIITYNLFNDIALVKLVKPVNVPGNPDLGTICLPPQANIAGEFDEYVGNQSITVGWGTTIAGENESASLVLQKLDDLPIVSTKWCQEVYKVEEKDLANTMICTYMDERDTCQGDSGGPLMLQIKGRWTVVGVTSFGHGCAEKGWPGVSAHVALYTNWVYKTIKEEEEKDNFPKP